MKKLMNVLFSDFCYDAFIIFNNKDQSWADETLLPILEVKHGLKCCVHYRDFEPGKPFVENMTDSVQKAETRQRWYPRIFSRTSFANMSWTKLFIKTSKRDITVRLS